MSDTIYSFWRHLKSGADYAIRTELGHVTGCVGPLSPDEIDFDQPDDYPWEEYADDGTWAEKTHADFRLYERREWEAANA